MATATEKTPTDYSLILRYRRTNRTKAKFFELGDHHQSIHRQDLPQTKNKRKNKVATPYLHRAVLIRPRSDALNVILRLNRLSRRNEIEC